MLKRLTTLLFILCLAAVVQAEPLNFAPHPVHYPDRQKQVFSPLAHYLKQSIAEPVVLLEFSNFHQFWADLRHREDMDLILVEPHLAAYMIEKKDYIPLAVANEPTRYSLLVSNPQYRAPADVVGLKVSALPSPSMGNVLLDEWFPNPLQRPMIDATARDWQDAIDAVFAEESAAAMIPGHLAAQYPNLQAIKTSDDYPGLTLLASEEVSEVKQKAIQDAMLALSADNPKHLEILQELNVTGFKIPDEDDYEDLEELLKNTFGF